MSSLAKRVITISMSFLSGTTSKALLTLNEDLCAAYDNDIAMDHKIENIYNIIHLVLSEDIDCDEDEEDAEDEE